MDSREGGGGAISKIKVNCSLGITERGDPSARLPPLINQKGKCEYPFIWNGWCSLEDAISSVRRLTD